MNLGDAILETTDIDIAAYVIHDLKKNGSKLSKFLSKEFEKKKIKVSHKKFRDNHKVVLAYGRKNVWWLVDPAHIDLKKVGELLKDKPVEIDYVIPVAKRKWAVVAEKEK